ncbi:MAG: SCO family protein [Deltaproteobacteria bacterium]|nr:SCO family protein [Deltaproteobacteria bacterium]
MGLLTRACARGLGGVLALILVVVASACDRDANPAIGRHAAHGIVEDVDRDNAQVLIEHDDVPGLMPAMTMNFLVRDAAVLARLARGQVIDFELEFTGRSYEVVDFEVVGEGAFDAGWRRLGDGLVRSSPVPDFELVDQSGARVHFAELGDRVLLIDFIYTECPGPCPVQTARQVALQRRIPEALRPRIHFLSLSLDPEHDGPAELERYAKARGADLSTWSFLTGPPETLASLARAYGVGSLRKENGTIDHTLVTFLVHEGRVLERYLPKPGEEDRLLADLVALAD